MADPPYERGAGRGWAEAILPELAGESILVPGGLVVIEQGSREPARGAPGLAVVRDKAYGDSRLVVYRRVTDEGRGRTT
jgi:16S rRNA G966 N2-methylase RsmD